MAVGNINLANVNISLAEFQKMSDGKYNAGEVKLTSETGLQKVNNHIHRLGANTTQISHEEVLAIKNAFVRALASSGVDAAEINKIRSELGLAPTPWPTRSCVSAASRRSPASRSGTSSTVTRGP
ncbi:MAG: hypothetical protein J6334_10880 [Kiritimatiellae bacterium]|nr:hypothetical protein [Kiritimatiellia bacterium]